MVNARAAVLQAALLLFVNYSGSASRFDLNLLRDLPASRKQKQDVHQQSHKENKPAMHGQALLEETPSALMEEEAGATNAMVNLAKPATPNSVLDKMAAFGKKVTRTLDSLIPSPKTDLMVHYFETEQNAKVQKYAKDLQKMLDSFQEAAGTSSTVTRAQYTGNRVASKLDPHPSEWVEDMALQLFPKENAELTLEDFAKNADALIRVRSCQIQLMVEWYKRTPATDKPDTEICALAEYFENIGKRARLSKKVTRDQYVEFHEQDGFGHLRERADAFFQGAEELTFEEFVKRIVTVQVANDFFTGASMMGREGAAGIPTKKVSRAQYVDFLVFNLGRQESEADTEALHFFPADANNNIELAWREFVALAVTSPDYKWDL